MGGARARQYSCSGRRSHGVEVPLLLQFSIALFTGMVAATFVPPVRKAIPTADKPSGPKGAVLFPSLSETFGNVTLEALASGLPVVAFDTAAAAEFVDDCASGLLAPVGAERAFIAAVCSLAWQHSHLADVRERARQSALKASWPDVLARFESHLVDTVSTVRAAAPGTVLAA